MSRVGKAKIKIPNNVSVEITGSNIAIKSKQDPKKEFNYVIPRGFNCVLTEGSLSVEPSGVGFSKSLWGTTTRNISNGVQGLDKPFETTINLVGVGFKSALQGSKLVLDLGFSHKIEYVVPQDVIVNVVKPNELKLSSFSKQKLGQVCGELIKFRPPEPYKGKGVIKEGAIIVRKEGKKK